MPTTTIASPGVAVSEIDATGGGVAPGGTSVLVAGFAPQGPTEEIFNVTSMGEFEMVYGMPTNAAERYFYQTARACFNSASRVLTTRLPYGSGSGLGISDDYTALFFPVATLSSVEAGDGTMLPLSNQLSAAGVSLSGSSDYDIKGYVFGKPTLVRLDKVQYQDLEKGNFTWENKVAANETFTHNSSTWGKAGMIVINTARTTVNDKYEGYYLALADNTNINPSTNFEAVRQAFTVSENSTDLTLEIPKTRLNFPLSGTPTSNDESVSEVLENLPGFDISTTEFQDTLTMGVIKLRSSIFATDTIKLDWALVEPYVASLDSYRQLQNPGGGNPTSFFLGDVTNGSGNIKLLVNQNISYQTGTWMNSAGTAPTKYVRVLTDEGIRNSSNATLSSAWGLASNVMTDLRDKAGLQPADALLPLGTFMPSNNDLKVIGNVPTKLDRSFRTIENLDLVNVDVSVEGGLGTIYAGAQYNQTYGHGSNKSDNFDDELVVDIGSIDHEAGTATGWYQTQEGAVTTAKYVNIRDNYRTIYTTFNDFAEFNRKDHVFVADPPRWIFVQGENSKVMEHDRRRTFTQSVYWPLRHVYGFSNTSYSTVYGNWGRCFDPASNRLTWCPFSGYAAATFANNDAGFAPWFAPAGFQRGRFGGVVDIATIPAQKHRDQLYKINVNPVTMFPGEGFVIYGQKTMFKKPSAFDRLNVRRLFLFLEKLVRGTMRQYVFEPNTLITRTSVLNTLTPMFESIRNEQGMYDYLIICDERNNSASVVDANELVVDIYIKPVRAAEIVLVNFHASRTGSSFSELGG